MAEDEVCEQGAGEGAAGAVGVAGFDVLALEVVDFTGGETKEVGGVEGVAGRGDDVQVRVALGQRVGCGFRFGEGLDGGGFRQGGELGPVRGDPGDLREETGVEDREGFRRKQFPSRAGNQDRIEHSWNVVFALMF